MYVVLFKPTMAKNLLRTYRLMDAIQPGSFEDENEGFANKEAEYIYDEIFFFTDAETLALPEEQFIEELKKDNREWFE